MVKTAMLTQTAMTRGWWWCCDIVNTTVDLLSTFSFLDRQVDLCFFIEYDASSRINSEVLEFELESSERQYVSSLKWGVTMTPIY